MRPLKGRFYFLCNLSLDDNETLAQNFCPPHIETNIVWPFIERERANFFNALSAAVIVYCVYITGSV